jgi:hypothetical protein
VTDREYIKMELQHLEKLIEVLSQRATGLRVKLGDVSTSPTLNTEKWKDQFRSKYYKQ